MSKRLGSAVLSPVRQGRNAPREWCFVSVRATPEQKLFLSRLGDGSLSLGFDRAVAAAAGDAARSGAR